MKSKASHPDIDSYARDFQQFKIAISCNCYVHGSTSAFKSLLGGNALAERKNQKKKHKKKKKKKTKQIHSAQWSNPSV